jgi:uncharacterized damage-inducible protein DinB
MSFMRRLTLLCAVATASAIFGAEPQAPSVAKMFDGQIKMIEGEAVSLAEAMPAEKYGFAPSVGEFKGARTFSQQVTHIAAVVYVVASAAMGEKNPSEAGPGENGPASIAGKAAAVQYLKDAFAYAHKAAGSLTAENMMEMVPSPFGNQKAPRSQLLNVVLWHSFDHYGQAAVYARMNGIVPPASR